MLSPEAQASFCIIFFGYVVSSALLQVLYYRRRAHEAGDWKIQPHVAGGLSEAARRRPYWLPPLLLEIGERLGLVSPKQPVTAEDGGGDKPRAPQHALFATCNLLTASTFAALTAEGYVRGWPTSALYALAPPAQAKETLPSLVLWLLGEGGRVVLGLAVQSVLEYWWHVLMHTRWCYRRMHKHHHYYTAPEPFDDMFIHPLEAVGYYFVLYSPSCLVPMSVGAFAVYMIILGTCGILDHSGIAVRVPGVYDTRDHDAHHSMNNCNYAFPFPYLDMLHGTYTGEIWGKRYLAGKGVLGPATVSAADGAATAASNALGKEEEEEEGQQQQQQQQEQEDERDSHLGPAGGVIKQEEQASLRSRRRRQ